MTDPRFDMAMPKHFTLDRLRFALQEVIPAAMMEHAKFEFVEDYIRREMVARLQVELLGQRVGRATAKAQASVDFIVPDGWWQHWKQDHRTRWYARWIIRRWPIRMRSVTRWANVEIDIERFRTFPQSTIRYPDGLGTSVHMLEQMEARWIWDDLAGPSEGEPHEARPL